MTILANFPTLKPSLLLDFANSRLLDPRITFTRASVGSYHDTNGVLQSAAAGVARFDHNPATGESLGLLNEEQRTNLLLNSATLSTQNVTVSAVAYTLSFYGSGSVSLSGAATGTLVGSGVYPAKVSLTFTPTAGTLTLTVSGTVSYANLEAGTYPTSWIATVGSAATRATDAASMTGTNFSSWYRQDEGSVFVEQSVMGLRPTGGTTSSPNIGDTASSIGLRFGAVISGSDYVVLVSNATQVDSNSFVVTANVFDKYAFAFKVNDFAVTRNAVTPLTDATGTVPTVSQLLFTRDAHSGHIKKLAFYPLRLPNAQLQALTS